VKATEDMKRTSWTSRGDIESLLQSSKEFSDWCKRLPKHAPEHGLWQLRDLDPLHSWTKGRAITIGDASHAMLPTQGQGANQRIEDAVGVPIANKISGTDIERNLFVLSLPT
jgi:salicylate hydroxylase